MTASRVTSPLLVPRAALVSVGGSPAPILYVLRKYRPANVWYFCSAGSRSVADELQSQLEWRPYPDFVEVERFEEIGPCYRALREAIPRLLQKWKIDPAEVVVDYTGGTKTMSAALVLAASERLRHFSYVGGEQREKGGLGVAMDGRERAFYESNPWSELSVREVERAADLWAHALFDGSAGVLRGTAGRTPRPCLFEMLVDVSDATAARHRLDFKNAQKSFGLAAKSSPALFDGRADYGLADYIEKSSHICAECAGEKSSPVLLRELLDNALRTSAQQRFEDAAARLYRAMEMQAQIWLTEVSAGAFSNGKLRRGASLPPVLADWPPCNADGQGEVCLSMEQCFEAVNRLGDKRTGRIVADIAVGSGGSRWRRASAKRNTSILAHGVSSIGQTGFEEMKQIAVEFLAFDLTRESNPIPPFDVRWAMDRA